MLGVVATGLIKLSVCFLYWNLFGKVRSLRYFLMFYMFFITAWTISFIAAGLAECGNHLMAVFGTPTEYLASCGHAVPTGFASMFLLILCAQVECSLCTLGILAEYPLPQVHLQSSHSVTSERFQNLFTTGFSLTVGFFWASYSGWYRYSNGLHHSDDTHSYRTSAADECTHKAVHDTDVHGRRSVSSPPSSSFLATRAFQVYRLMQQRQWLTQRDSAIGGSIAKAYIYIAGSKGQYTEDAIRRSSLNSLEPTNLI